MRVRQVWHARGSNEWHWFMLPATTPQEPGKKERTLATRLPKKRCMGCATWQHVKMVCKPACMAVGSNTAGRVWEVSYELHGGTMATRVWARLASDRPCTAGHMGMPPARSCQPTRAAMVKVPEVAAAVPRCSLHQRNTAQCSAAPQELGEVWGALRPPRNWWPCSTYGRAPLFMPMCRRHTGASVFLIGATAGGQPHPRCFGAAAVCF